MELTKQKIIWNSKPYGYNLEDSFTGFEKQINRLNKIKNVNYLVLGIFL